MVAKLLAGLAAAIAVTVVGVYAAFGTGSCDHSSDCSLTVSEGSCCAVAHAAPCCELSATTSCASEDQPAIRTSAAACIGGTALAANTAHDLDVNPE